MKEIIFVIAILVWCFIGFIGILRANYGMIIFMALAPFIPLLAMVCGLL